MGLLQKTIVATHKGSDWIGDADGNTTTSGGAQIIGGTCLEQAINPY
ncbi:hypothetical protein [Aliivibrio fischeri]|uniref:Uncharacterized protein n=1 Tax=Aliivibrio fischeri TaxID=668 RepID=A0A844P743_ALIFS|nr:hypothetical protein [Aliivibrio fischeri]MUK51194.1 hypothetical protein [Aliivibrio fischeri]